MSGIYARTHGRRTRGHLFAGAGSDLPVDSDRLRGRLFEPSAAARADVSMPPAEVLHEHHSYLSLMLELARNPDEFDVIHNHSLHYLPVAMGPSVQTPMLTTLHTPPTPWLESALTLAPGTRCVAVSRHTAQAWAHVLGTVPVVHNGVRLDRWTSGPGGDDLVWFGRIVPEKGTHLAIEAARRPAAGFGWPVRSATSNTSQIGWPRPWATTSPMKDIFVSATWPDWSGPAAPRS